MGRVSVGCRISQGENQGVDRSGAMVQERRGTYQDGSSADPHPPPFLSPSFGRWVCLIHRGHPPTSPGPHPPAPSTLRRLHHSGAASLFCRVKESQRGTTQMRVRLLTIAVFAALLAVGTCQDTEHPELEQCKVQVSAALRTSPGPTPNSTGQICAPERTFTS